jgi:hypothetical protein
MGAVQLMSVRHWWWRGKGPKELGLAFGKLCFLVHSIGGVLFAKMAMEIILALQIYWHQIQSTNTDKMLRGMEGS